MKNTEQKPPSDFEVMQILTGFILPIWTRARESGGNTLSSVSKRICWKI